MDNPALPTIVESVETVYSEQPYTPNRKDNYLPNRLVISNTKFSRVEQRLFEYFVNQINHNSINPKHGLIVRIPITQLKEKIKAEQMMLVMHSMATKVMTFYELSENGLQAFEHIPIFSNVSYNKGNNGYIEFMSNPQLSPYLSSLGNQYTRYDFKTILNFKSIYSTLLYKLIKLHTGQNRYQFIYSIAELRRLLQVDDKKYQNYNDFKKKVLEPARKELREADGVPIEFEYENHGGKIRNVTHIEFKIITAREISNVEKQKYEVAVASNKSLVNYKVEEIMIKDYTLRAVHRNMILNNADLQKNFVNLHIEFGAGLHPNVKNKTAYMIVCLGLNKKK
jgi:plasmid replication initiation protein